MTIRTSMRACHEGTNMAGDALGCGAEGGPDQPVSPARKRARAYFVS
jgi:hypothetical protein